MANRLLANPTGRQHPHCLGAVVLQQVQKQAGHLQERTVIDGQQRLTTLQLFMDALHAELVAAGAAQAAMRLGALVTNAEAFCANPEDRFKVWPTNRDRAAFNAVMGATKGYNKAFAELVPLVRGAERPVVGDAVAQFFASQRSDSRYWPDDDNLQREVRDLLAYRRIGRGRLRMVLEAVEDHKRGWRAGSIALGEERVTRGKYAIEHIMPRKWVTHWPLPSGVDADARDRLVHTVGNLTLLTGRLNSKVSNGPWLGEEGKRAGLVGHDVLMLNRDLRDHEAAWGEDGIRQRTEDVVRIISAIWPVPTGHRSGYTPALSQPNRHHIELADLIGAGLLTAGMPLFGRSKRTPDRVATLLADGRIEVDGLAFDKPSEAAKSVTGRPTSGWWFFLVQQTPRRSLKQVWRAYMDGLAMDGGDDDEGDEDEDES